MRMFFWILTGFMFLFSFAFADNQKDLKEIMKSDSVKNYEKSGYKFEGETRVFFTKNNLSEPVKEFFNKRKIERYKDYELRQNAYSISGRNYKYLKVKKDIRIINLFLFKKNDNTNTKPDGDEFFELDLLLFLGGEMTVWDYTSLSYAIEPIKTKEEANELTNLYLANKKHGDYYTSEFDMNWFIIKSKKQYNKIRENILKKYSKNSKEVSISDKDPEILLDKVDGGFKISVCLYDYLSITGKSFVILNNNITGVKEETYIKALNMVYFNTINAPHDFAEEPHYKKAREHDKCIKGSFIEGEYQKIEGGTLYTEDHKDITNTDIVLIPDKDWKSIF